MKVRQRFDLIGRERLKQVLKEDIKQEFVKSTVPREKNDIKLIHDLVSLQREKLLNSNPISNKKESTAE
ncbi:hypothetical protein [Paenibacillus sp. DMB20]|uniref:hypothetical protein n=1 Tax=Paenibacillus sp. DMB20 TaxID=1642570 RepID=UPI000628272C|nr:hypothetical protein [Paenibacillus sp. DMB20]KKO53471.1 hypothetical protein XI25_12800 [Paenibacillus sp. DMB20]